MRRKIGTGFIFFILLVFSSFPVSAKVTSSTPIVSTSGLSVLQPEFSSYPDDMLRLHVHVFNQTNHLVPPDKADCLLHVYNQTGKHIIEAWMLPDTNNVDFYYNIGAGNFTEGEEYRAIIQCNISKVGGFTSTVWEITDDGSPSAEPTKDESIVMLYNLFAFFLYVAMMGGLVFLMHHYKEDPAPCVFYGVVGSAMSFIMLALFLGGWSVFAGLTFIIDIDYYLMALTASLGLYSAAIGWAFYQDMRLKDE